MDDENHQSQSRWQFKREVSLGDILMVIAMAAPALWWGSGVNERIAVLQAQNAYQASRDTAQDLAIREGQQRIEAQLQEINRYLREIRK